MAKSKEPDAELRKESTELRCALRMSSGNSTASGSHLMSGDMKKFTNLFSQLENVDFHDCENLTGLDHFNKERKNWKELENLSAKAMSVVT